MAHYDRRLTIRLSTRDRDRLQAQAGQDGCSPNAFVRALMEAPDQKIALAEFYKLAFERSEGIPRLSVRNIDALQ